LAVAHRAGIIHRDLKPSNIMLTRAGGVVLLDFGVAKLLDVAGDTEKAVGVAPDSLSRSNDEAEPLTTAGTVIGTRFYMAPEQATGGRVDQRVDLFAAGAVLQH